MNPGFYGHYNTGGTLPGATTIFTEPMVVADSPPILISHDTGRDEERARCLAILRKVQAECNLQDPEEVFAFNRLGRAISQIESGGNS